MASIISMNHYTVETFEPNPYFEMLDGNKDHIGIADVPSDGGILLTSAGFDSGRPLKDEFIPKRVRRLGAGLTVYPKLDCHLLFGRFMVSPRFRDIVEAFEPGVHQFFPIDVSIGGIDEFYGPYFLFHCCQRIDGLHPILAQPRNARGCLIRGPDKKRRIILSHEKVRLYHIWSEQFVSLGISGAFISNQLTDAFLTAGLTGFNVTYIEEV